MDGVQPVLIYGCDCTLATQQLWYQKQVPGSLSGAGQPHCGLIWHISAMGNMKRYRPNECISELLTAFKVDGRACLNIKPLYWAIAGTLHVWKVCGTLCACCSLSVADDDSAQHDHCQRRALLELFVCLFVYLLLRTGVQPTLDPSTETLCRSNALAWERRGIGWCMRVYVWCLGWRRVK